MTTRTESKGRSGVLLSVLRACSCCRLFILSGRQCEGSTSMLSYVSVSPFGLDFSHRGGMLRGCNGHIRSRRVFIVEVVPRCFVVVCKCVFHVFDLELYTTGIILEEKRNGGCLDSRLDCRPRLVFSNAVLLIKGTPS